MVQEVELGGKMRPILFGFGAMYAYEGLTGRSAIKDFQAQEGGNYSLTMIVDLVYSGLYCGHQKQKIQLDFDRLDVAGWLGESQDTIEVIVKMFVESFPKAKNEIPPAMTVN